MMYDAKRYYACLGVAPGCSDEEIRAAFRRRAKQLHPDSGSGDEGEFIRLKKAYDVLAQPGKRAHYDRLSRPRATKRPKPPEWMPPTARERRYRLGGMSWVRFAAAFAFMTGLSLAALEVILADSGTSPEALFDFSGHPVTATRDKLQLGLGSDPAQFANKGASLMNVGETADEFADRMQRVTSSARLHGQDPGGEPAP